SPAGLAAALAAADAGASVTLVDENAQVGGSGAWCMPAEKLATMAGRALHHENIETLTSTIAAGFYADRWIALVEPARLTKMRASAIVFATGVIEQPAVFRNNDVPGVMLGSAAQRLVRRHAVAPGRRVVVLTANREGYELASALRAFDIGVAAVLDLRAGAGGEDAGLEDLRRDTAIEPVAAKVRDGVVCGLEFRRSGTRDSIDCDAVLMSVGFAPASQLLLQAGVEMRFDAALQQHVPVKHPSGVFGAGRANGVYDLAAQRQDGRDAGTAAAAFARGEPVSTSYGQTARRETVRQVSHGFPVFAHARARDFVDLDEDIQVKDLLNSAQEGFDSTELLKRYSTLGMGPSQGKHSNLNGARILMRAREATLADTALTTQRPFYHPVALKHLAGARFHVHRHTAVHAAHEALGAGWMTVGGWQRPQYYLLDGLDRDACIADEVRAVRQRCGLIDVSTLGKIEIHGPDAGRFLDRIYTGNFADLRIGMTRYGLLLDESGIVRDDGVIARRSAESYYFTTTTSGAASVYRELLLWNARWRMGCTLANVTGHRAAFNVAGPASREVLRQLTDIDVSDAAFPFLAAREGSVAGVVARVMRVGFVSALGFEIHVPYSQARKVWDALSAAMAPVGGRAFGVEAQRVLRLEKGHAIVAQDTDNLTNPFEAGLGWAVKMGKPFFVGQRSLRIHEQRGARQRLIGFELPAGHSAVHEANLVIAGGDIAGRVTSLARSPTLDRTIGLAMVEPRLATTDSLSIRTSDGKSVTARIVRTPFVEAA
ncbi:MAG: FAD-dependent oxidoreductase, partial [Steroidobacteraceae bacterium]|nr:FAD-dependent oxidoreductase [Steroidobacteraceae bacterium]